MRFNCGPTLGQRLAIRRARLEEWHRWFAWHPVRFDDDATQCAWLETIERRGSWRGCWIFWYRPASEPAQEPK